MLPKSILITGSNRGLGLEFITQLTKASSPPSRLIAACRDPDNAKELLQITDKNKDVHIVKFDAKNDDDYITIANKVSDIVGDAGLNVLINNAGISSRFTRINLVKWEQMRENLLVNTIAPVMLTKSLLPLLKKSASQFEGSELSFRRAAVINMSSILGSISENDKGGFYPYRSSKAALNAVGKSMSIDLRGDNILVTNLHPGWVQTDMGGASAPLSKEDSVATMLNTFTSLTEKQHGAFINYDGTSLEY